MVDRTQFFFFLAKYSLLIATQDALSFFFNIYYSRSLKVLVKAATILFRFLRIFLLSFFLNQVTINQMSHFGISIKSAWFYLFRL